MSRHSSPRHLRGLPRWFKIITISVLVLANVGAFGTWWLLDSVEASFQENVTRLDEVVPELTERPVASTEPLVVLVIGSDSRSGLESLNGFGDFPGARSDAIMAVRADPGAGSAQILSIPRDTLVPIEGHEPNRLNAAYALGGASLMVNTVRQVLDIPIHHYVEVDFVGFQALVEELGGVEVTFAHPARDHKSRLDVPAGTVLLDGDQALAYARSRYYQEQRNGSWRSVEASDIGRAQRQQSLILAILDRLARPATVAEATGVVGTFARHLSIDATLADSSLIEMAFAMRGIGAADIETATLPTTGGRDVAGRSVQTLLEPEAGQMLAAFRAGRPMDRGEPVDTLTVQVLNGNGMEGSAGRWAETLRGRGYEVGEVANAEVVDQARTVVIVAPDRFDDGQRIVADLGFGTVEQGTVGTGLDATVVLGTDAEAA